MTHVIFDPCIRDGACADVCPVACILPGQPEAVCAGYDVDPDACIDCGDCVPVCPVDAICTEEKLPLGHAAAPASMPAFFGRDAGRSCSRALVAPVSIHRHSVWAADASAPRRGVFILNEDH